MEKKSGVNLNKGRGRRRERGGDHLRTGESDNTDGLWKTMTRMTMTMVRKKTG